MQKRRIGQSDLRIAPIILGGNVFGWTADEKTSFDLLDAFVDAGFDMVDTANTYSTWTPAGGGASESMIGKWLKRSGKRAKVLIATKVGAPMTETEKGLSPAYIEREVENSLRRLQTDVIDLYQSHRDDPDAPQEAVMEAYDRLIRAGKVRAVGSSNFAPQRIASANAAARAKGLAAYQSEQSVYNLMERGTVENGLSAVTEAEGMSIIPFYGLASGFLTGKYRSKADLGKSPRGHGVEKYLTPKGFAVLAALDAVAARHDSTPARVALAWQIAKPFITAPIVSATSLAQLSDILGAADLKLDNEDMAKLDAASA